MNRDEKTFCLFCILTGYIAPWGLIFLGAIMGFISTSPYWEKTSVWIMAAGFVALGFSYLFARAYNRFIFDQRDK